MNKTIKVSASILCADFSRLANDIKRCEDAGVDVIHVDVMDGHFVPNITIGPVIVEAIRPLTRLPIESHLMIEHPGLYIDDFLKAGSDVVCIHAECYGPRRASCRGFGQYPKEVDAVDGKLLKADLKKIREKGKKSFLVLNPGTPLCVKEVLSDLDGVLVMSVNPGFPKQKFIPEVLPKIKRLREIFKGDIEVDGGINQATAPEAVGAGANILVSASYFFSASNPGEAVRYLKSLR